VSLYPMKIFTGSAHPELALEIGNILQLPLGKTTTVHLDDSEIYVTIDEAVRDRDIFLVQPCSMPVNDNLMELLLYLDAFRRASVHSINVVIPYFPYARQDRMARGREAISSRVVASLLEAEGAKRRTDFSTTRTTHVVGDIAGRRPIIIDDIIAGGSVLKQLDILYQEGAEGKSCFAITHPVLLPSALETLETDERIEKLVVANTVPVPAVKRSPKLEVLSIGPLLAGIISDIHAGRSISSKLGLS